MITALLVTSAATLLESAPFILAAAVFVRMPLRLSSRMVPYLGCGCGTGPSARSLPAAAATWLVFGPLVAGARLAAAIAVERFTPRAGCTGQDDAPLAQLAVILPLSLAGAFAALFAPVLFGEHVSSATAFLGGAVTAFVMSPCGIGTIGLAASLRNVLPGAAAGFLCIAGVIDVRTWLRVPHVHRTHDALAYAIAAVACAFAASKNGAGLVHPKLMPALWICAIVCGFFAYRHRLEQDWRLRLAPIVMLAGTILAAPPPAYHATETSLSDAFAGERIDFTGIATQTRGTTTLVRYAITCCRADASPIVIAFAESAPSAQGWLHARGVLVQTAQGLRLRVDSMQRITPPADPFVYR